MTVGLDEARHRHLVASQRVAAAWLAYDAAIDAMDGVSYDRSDAAHDALDRAHDDHRAALAVLLRAEDRAKRPVSGVLLGTGEAPGPIGRGGVS